MISSPFDDPAGVYCVLSNDEEQHSLWPAFAPIPDGWHAIHPRDSRPACLEHIATRWTDLRPKSVTRSA